MRRRIATPGTSVVLIAAGALGFVIWAAGFAGWQVAVETGQVIAGKVAYPADNPFYIYHLKLWSILHEICALLLNHGVSEIALSTIISGLLGMTIMQALAMFVYVLSGDAVVSIGAAFAIVMSRAAEYGVTYPIYLTTTTHTYGVIGLALVVLVAALLAAGSDRLGGLLLGIAPSVHPSLGIWLGIILAICVISRPKMWMSRNVLGRLLPFFAAGCAVTLVSLFLHLGAASRVPAAVPSDSAKYFSAFVDFWDGHRQRVDLGRKGVSLNIAALIVSIVWLRRYRGAEQARPLREGAVGHTVGAEQARPARPASERQAMLIRFVAVSAALSLVLALVSWIPASYLPSWYLVLMPTRLLNICAMTFVALLYGLVGARRDVWGYALAAFLTAGLLVSDRSMLPDLLHRLGLGGVPGSIPLLAIPAITLAALAFVTFRSRWPADRSLRSGDPDMATEPVVGSGVTLLSTALFVLAGLLLAALSLQASREVRAVDLRDRTNDPFFARVASGTGLLLTGADLHLVQLRTRRPVLLDGGGLDGLAYAPEAGPGMAKILKEVYGIDLLDPPAEARGLGAVPQEANRTVWEGYSLAAWQGIGRQFGVKEVLAYEGWRLDLPVVDRGAAMTLYEIPDAR